MRMQQRTSRVLTYRFERVPAYYQAAFVSFIFLITFGFLSFRNLLMGNQQALEISQILIVFSVLSAFSVFVWMSARSRAKSRVTVSEEGVTIENRKGKKYLKWSDVASVRISVSPAGKCEVLTHSGEKHIFSMALERSEYIIESLRRARPELLTESDYSRYLALAIITDHAWARLFSRVLNTKKNLLKYLVLNVVLSAIVFWLAQSQLNNIHKTQLFIFIFLGFSVISLAIANLIVNASEFYLVRLARKLAEAKKEFRIRNMALEKRVERMGDLVHVLIMLVLMLSILYMVS